jgi:hypothetical protein
MKGYRILISIRLNGLPVHNFEYNCKIWGEIIFWGFPSTYGIRVTHNEEDVLRAVQLNGSILNLALLI